MVCYDSDMDYTVNMNAEDCLVATQAYFVRQWPYRGRVDKSNSAVIFTERGGCLAMFLVPLILSPKGVQVFITTEGHGSRLTVSAGRNNYSRTMDAWLRAELGAEPA